MGHTNYSSQTFVASKDTPEYYRRKADQHTNLAWEFMREAAALVKTPAVG